MLPADELIAYGVTGPLLRAAGVDLDLRRAQPYLVYDQLDFDVPLGTHGDNMDRFLVRVEEIGRARASSSSACGCCRTVRSTSTTRTIRWPAKARVYNRMEELIDQFKLVTEGPKPPPGEVYVGDRVGQRRDRLLPGERRHAESRTSVARARRASRTRSRWRA